MNHIHAYLTFDGNCREAMTFYKDALSAELMLSSFGESGFGDDERAKNRIMHAKLTKGHAVLMASDNMPGMTLQQGNNFSVSIDCAGAEELDRYFAALAAGGKVTMEVQDTFWGARFGMLTDKFGIQWMLNYDKPKS